MRRGWAALGVIVAVAGAATTACDSPGFTSRGGSQEPPRAPARPSGTGASPSRPPRTGTGSSSGGSGSSTSVPATSGSAPAFKPPPSKDGLPPPPLPPTK